MSSDEAMSVVGNEVVPLEYGGMDSETSPSPTSLERMVEERREEVVVEEEEEDIPSNVLEFGDGVDGCYDPNLEIVSEVRGYVSELGSRNSLRGLVGNCNLPHHVLIRPAGVNERACSAPRDHWMPIYLHYLIAGLRFSIPELLVGLLLDYSIGITQLTPNAIRVVIAEMEEFTNAAGGLRIPKKPRKKSKTSAMANRGVPEGERLPSTSARAKEVQPRPEPMMGGSEDASEETAPLQRKKRRVVELECRGDEVVEFVPQPSPPEIDPEVRGREEAEVQGLSGGRERTPTHAYQKSLFEATNMTGAKHFLNATLPDVDRMQAKDEI
ncbi:hypothetical protein SLEP1_g43922 [Rubroshorea leprosula]|uniref:Uncharacterized protein n=1 Tax=Rubroshorea leprosula TaxID=152421 RepID=A0AAV5LF30_9ROSI|nr:hypothetical protein SLEP1_g43922 [Rubroshorea leprosula]